MFDMPTGLPDPLRAGMHIMPREQSVETRIKMAEYAEALIQSPWRRNMAMWVGNVQIGDALFGFRIGLS